jgi:HK97 gp10 family phage protein
MIQFSYKLEGADEFVKRFKSAPQRFDATMKRFMNKAVIMLQSEARKNTPVNTGLLRSSITHEVRDVGANMLGIVGTAVAYAPYVEEGSRPHWPPSAPIRYWVMRKFKARGPELESLTFLVQRAIARHGTKGAHMFKKAFEAMRTKIGDLWISTWADAINKEL